MGIFDNQSNDLFTNYHARIKFRDRLMGGVPKDPRIIEGWLRSKAGISDVEEVRQAMIRTLLDLGAEVTPDMSYEQLEDASKKLAAVRQTNGFKVNEHGPYVESRAIKALLKEVTNVLYAGERWGTTKKGPKAFLAERVFVNPDHINLGQPEPSGVELFIGHVNGPRGPQSNVTYFEYVEGATIEFDVMVAEDAIPQSAWPRIWLLAQEEGLGALRSQGRGRFDIEAWEPTHKSKGVISSEGKLASRRTLVARA